MSPKKEGQKNLQQEKNNKLLVIYSDNEGIKKVTRGGSEERIRGGGKRIPSEDVQ